MVKLRLVLALLALLVAIPTAKAQEWPNRPVRFIVPFPAGGSTDVGARLIGEYLSRSLRRQIVVENKSGANGNIGIETAAKSPADGYTVLVVTDALTSNPHVYKMNVEPLKALTPVIQLSRQPMVLAAHPSLGVASLAELTYACLVKDLNAMLRLAAADLERPRLFVGTNESSFRSSRPIALHECIPAA